MTNSQASGSAERDGPGRSRSFDLLHESIRRWVWDQRWKELHDIQEQSIPVILEGARDVILAAATAGGKTEAAFLPICSRLLEDPRPSVQALYVGPLRALINDQFRRLELLCRDVQIPVHRWHGDVPQGRKKALLGSPGGILLITPESLEALFVIHGLRVPSLFADLRYVVVDELHAYPGSERGRQLQNLLHRLELALRRRVPRIGLSATLGDMELSKTFLRPGGGDRADLLVSSVSGQEIRLLVKGYVERVRDERSDDVQEAEDSPASLAIAAHMLEALRGSHNLVFANSRHNVEWFADQLLQLSDRNRLPNEFFPHHGSLARGLREHVEGRLRDGTVPTTVVCTSTLEMGIDIGSVKSIAQIGAPPSVASLRQRLGRSGRRPGEPAVLRAYVTEGEIGADTLPQDAIRAELVQTVAMIRLVLDGWCEPPATGALHLSTLVQQLLSVIAQHGSVSAADAWRALCESGPFAGVDQPMFAEILRNLGEHDLLTQLGDGSLTLGLTGERVVGHHTFYAAFQTPEEWVLVAPDRTLGSLPLVQPLREGVYLIFAGHRWNVTSVDPDRRVVHVVPGRAGRVPHFSGGGAVVHDRIREEMRAVYVSEEVPAFLDAPARQLLAEGREWFQRLGLAHRAMLSHGRDTILFPWIGDAVVRTLLLIVQEAGFDALEDGISLTVMEASPEQLVERLRIATQDVLPSPSALAARVANLRTEKFDAYLPDEVVREDYAGRYLNLPGAERVLARLLSNGT